MKFIWQRFVAALTPGVRVILILLSLVYLAFVVGKLTRAFDLYFWLAANASAFWHGQVWRIVTYVLLPMGILDFVMNGFALVLLGSMLERHWSRGELWLFCITVVVGTGLTAVFLLPVFVGAAPLMMGLLIAWAFVSGHEVVSVPIFGPIKVRHMVFIFAAVSLLVMIFSAGLAAALVMASGGLTGWLYLWLRHKWLMSRPSHTVHSERINRLEL